VIYLQNKRESVPVDVLVGQRREPMKIDYISGVCRFETDEPYGLGNISLKSEQIFDVRKVPFSFMDQDITFVCLTSVHRYFFYQDDGTYLKILRLMYENPKTLKPILLRNYSASGIEKELLVLLFSEMCGIYDTPGYRYLEKWVKREDSPDKFDLSKVFDPIGGEHGALVKDETTNLYEKLTDLLPQNISRKREEIKQQERHWQRKARA
jgi:hypothetical protein